MKFRNYFLVFTISILSATNIFPYIFEDEAPFEVLNSYKEPTAFFKLDSEPTVRIGLLRNAVAATIATRDGTLVAEQKDEPKNLVGTSVRVSSRAYSSPVLEYYQFEIPDILTREEADELASRIKAETNENASVMAGNTVDTWKIRVGGEIETKLEADNYVAFLTEKGFANVKIISTKYTSPSDEAIALTRQISQKNKSKVRSLTTDVVPNRNDNPRRKNMNAVINPSLREVVANGGGVNVTTLKPVTIGTTNPRGTVLLNGKRYRGKMEVFVNADGRITVVNVVPIEDYLLGVVPAELSLPQLEAQKAQAVAARTYALGNKDAYDDEGFDMVDTVWSQVYRGIGIETAMGTRAVNETRGVYALYNGKPINAMFTSTCGGRTEDSGNIYEFNEPYLRGVHCSLEGGEHFAPFTVKTNREPALIRNEANYEFVRLASKYAVNNFLFATNRFNDEYFEDAPTDTELKSWMNQLAGKFVKPFPVVSHDSSKPLNLARILHRMIYDPTAEADADTLMSEADIDYQLSFADAGEIPKDDRIIVAMLLRDGWFSIYSDLTIKPNKHYSRGKILHLIDSIYNKKKWGFTFDSGTANPTEDGKLMLKSGRSEREITINANAFLFRKFGDSYYQVKETALLGGERIFFKTGIGGEVVYLEVEPTEQTTVAEKMSPFTNWRTNKSAAAVRAGLGKYVKGISGSLIDVNITKQGFSKRAIELEITTTTGKFKLAGGKIRSALGLREQLFVMDKRYSGGRVTSFSFTGRGWGHGIGMCQYGAYGFAKMGVKYDKIIRHYYTGINLVKAY